MSVVADWILKNSDSVEKAVHFVGKGCEVLAATVGQFHPILEAVFKVSAELFSNPEGKEAKYLTTQFERVNQNLEKIQDEIKKTELAKRRSSLNIQNFQYYTQIRSQYDKFMYIFTAKPKFKKLKIEQFLIHFKETGREKNLDCLYDAIVKENISGNAMLDTILATEQRSRRAVEEFCASLKKVFVVGIIALMGYSALKEGTADEDIMKKWQDRMEDVEKRMKAAVDECVNNFADQAKIDIDQKLKESPSSVSPEFTKFLLDALAEKYDWVSWSVRVFKDDGCKLWKFLCGKQHHISGGGVTYFEYLCNTKVRIVVSFTADPKSLVKSQIKDQTENEKGNLESVAESLRKSFPNCLVHAIRRCKRVEEANNFDPEHIYYVSHEIGHIFIHSG